MKIMLGNKKVNGISKNDPNKFTKSPMNGSAAATTVFTTNSNARRKNKRLMFSLECMPLSSFRNLVSKASWTGAINAWNPNPKLDITYKVYMILNINTSKTQSILILTCWEIMDCVKTTEFIRIFAHFGPLKSAGRYSETDEP